MKQRLLVVFDLNGTLLHRPRGFVHPEAKNLVNLTVRGFKTYLRPHLDVFIEQLFHLKNVRIAVWTSAHVENAVALSKIVFGKHYSKLEFILDRSHCRGAPMARKSSKVTKPLDFLWSHPVHNRYSLWNPENTIVFDDSASKLVKTPFNRFPIPEFDTGLAYLDPTQDTALISALLWIQSLQTEDGFKVVPDVLQQSPPFVNGQSIHDFEVKPDHEPLLKLSESLTALRPMNLVIA